MRAVTMTVVDGSAYPGQVKETILNATDTEIDSGNSADFFLQVEQNGRWYDLEENGDFANTAEAYIFEKDHAEGNDLPVGRPIRLS